MRNRLHVSFCGLHLTAEGIVAIGAALLIMLALWWRHPDFEYVDGKEPRAGGHYLEHRCWFPRVLNR